MLRFSLIVILAIYNYTIVLLMDSVFSARGVHLVRIYIASFDIPTPLLIILLGNACVTEPLSKFSLNI